MKFTSKQWWVEYTPDITREDFELFVDFLLKEGWSSYIHFCDYNVCWDNFVTQGYLRSRLIREMIEDETIKEFCIDNNPQYMSNEEQIDLASILGNKKLTYEIY